MRYRGSCHCGNVQFEVEGEPDSALACNCSICQRKGSLLWFVPMGQFHLLTDDNNSRTYTFNQHIIQHHFCPVCGIHPYAEGMDKSGNKMAAINLRCLQDFDLDSLEVTHFNGREL